MPNNSKADLFHSFLAGAVASVCTIALWKRLSLSSKQKTTPDKTLNNTNTSGGPTLENDLSQRMLPDDFREEQLSRNMLYFGDTGMKNVCESSVVVVGLGGVGSHAAHMLARAGVGHLRLIDFDQVTLSSLNRHACATLSDVGTPKVEAVKKHIISICAGHCKVDARVAMFTEQSQDELLGFLNDSDRRHDFIVDAIDDVTTKVQLLAYCVRNGTRVISCMGAGGKSDATRIQIGDLPSACHDPLATKMKLFLKRKKVDVTSELINIVYSSEKTVAPLAELSQEQKLDGNETFGAVDHMRVRVLPVLGTTPAIMGNACAAFALCEIANKPFSPLSGERMGRGVRHKIFQHLKNREKATRIRIEKEHGIEESSDQSNDDEYNDEEDLKGEILGKSWVGPVQVDCDDVEYLVAEVWRNRCAVSGDRMGVVLELARWNLSLPSVCQNLVLLGAKAMHALDKNGKESFEPSIRKKIEQRLATCKVDALS